MKRSINGDTTMTFDQCLSDPYAGLRVVTAGYNLYVTEVPCDDPEEHDSTLTLRVQAEYVDAPDSRAETFIPSE